MKKESYRVDDKSLCQFNMACRLLNTADSGLTVDFIQFRAKSYSSPPPGQPLIIDQYEAQSDMRFLVIDNDFGGLIKYRSIEHKHQFNGISQIIQSVTICTVSLLFKAPYR